ncbi:GIN domain-containing protein [Muriicola sp.]|uniref:GIN domain-containing protein n=1 Tax=Muriicola sp. TaxID=2020856 RepID=UPI003567C850
MRTHDLILLLVFLTVSSLSLTAQKKPKIKGNKEVIQVKQDIDGTFNSLEVDDGLEVNLNPGARNGYILETDANLVDVIQFFVVDSVLRVYTTQEITSSKKLDIYLGVSNIEHLILKNDAKVTAKDPFRAERFYLAGYNSSRFELNVQASDVTITLHRNAGGKIEIEAENTTIIMNDRTDMKAEAETKNLRVTVNNTADLKIDGRADYAAYNLKKSSKLDGRDMRVSSVDLYTSNNADVYVHATKNLEVDAQGNSNVYVYGNPDVEVKGFTDRSKIIKR